MKRISIWLVLLLSLLPFANSHAEDFIVTETKLLLLAALSAEEPEVAAAVDALVLFTVPTSPEFPTTAQKIVAYVGLGALALYNYEAEDEDYSKKEIFNTNLVVFNIVLFGELLGLNDGASRFAQLEETGSTFNVQMTRAGEPRFNWHYRFD